MKAYCPQCGHDFDANTGRFNRAQKIGAPLYCGRTCAGIAHRSKDHLTNSQKRAAKSEYDKDYRAKNLELIKAKKRDYFKRSYDPKAAAVIRKERMPIHVEYCRRPEYKAWKSEYDKRHLARKAFGEFAEVALLLRDIENEIEQRATRYEIYQTNGTINKAQTRRRAL